MLISLKSDLQPMRTIANRLLSLTSNPAAICCLTFFSIKTVTVFKKSSD